MKRLITAVLLMTFIFLNAFSQLGDGKFSWSDIVYAMALPFAVFTGCKTEPTPPELVTVTQNVTASFPTFTTGNAFNLTPTYTPNGGWGEHFSDADKSGITYTVTVTGPNDFNHTYNSGTGFIANTADNGGYQPYYTYTFTQTFKTGTTIIGNQVIKVTVGMSGFVTLKDANDVNLTPQQIPSVPLTLSKQVQP